jgi:signal transduction histidine kinase
MKMKGFCSSTAFPVYQNWAEFYRGEIERGVVGSSLGLALVRAIAERHNGQVGMHSRLGQGTVFILRLLTSRFLDS